ncbi:hypothetical protein NZK35_16655 [Stieleria sp. ICT_E10.1]|uniref:hypothetical protein n=1 Tax=Stieleria sedimenti TaxID=2976331 RepID=UPI002180362E|nr:hypothetical protein [Stieleria sedimenti]MCS7468284.1 hypothetical protein [Stieleria sedimenti]
MEIERDDPLHRIFETVVMLAANVDSSTPADYQAAWDRWYRGCGELQDLGLWIGDAEGPIEEFSLESDWTIEWSNMETDDAFL